jgi:uncharacterized protein (TIGR00255 family)
MVTDSSQSSQSMTGFASASAQSNSGEFNIEIKSVNSRFLDISCRLPSSFQSLELDLRNQISRRITRGKVDVSVSFSEQGGASRVPQLDAKRLISCFEQASSAMESVGLSTPSRCATLFSQLVIQRDFWNTVSVVEIGEADKQIILSLCNTALDALVTMRQQEAVALLNDIRQRLSLLQAGLEQIKKRAIASKDKRVEALKERIQEITSEYEVAEERWLSEIAFIAEKSDITEELVRFESHLAQTRTLLDEPLVGKKLTFLQQELLREANTITSKAQDAEIKYQVVEIKSELERIREQAQNLE